MPEYPLEGLSSALAFRRMTFRHLPDEVSTWSGSTKIKQSLIATQRVKVMFPCAHPGCKMMVYEQGTRCMSHAQLAFAAKMRRQAILKKPLWCKWQGFEILSKDVPMDDVPDAMLEEAYDV